MERLIAAGVNAGSHDITAEFRSWAGRKNLMVSDANYYDLWAEFLDEEYNEQRKDSGR